jgi:hypothetical protein
MTKRKRTNNDLQNIHIKLRMSNTAFLLYTLSMVDLNDTHPFRRGRFDIKLAINTVDVFDLIFLLHFRLSDLRKKYISTSFVSIISPTNEPLQYLVFNDLRSEWIVHFVDICVIVDHSYLRIIC